MAVNSGEQVGDAMGQFRECKPASKALLGSVLGHAAIWLLISLLLFTINLLTTLLMPPWFIFPVIGWGFGVTVHALVVVCVMFGLGLEDDLRAMRASLPRSFFAKDGGHLE